MSYLSRLRDDAEKRQGGEPSKGSKGTFEAFEGNASGPFAELAADLVDGLLKLQAMRVPRITLPQVWPEIVADAVRLARDGWAQQALALGWSPLDLWGCWTRGDEQPGLAVWLARRPVLLLSGDSCTVSAGQGRAMYTRRPMLGAVPLWELNAADTRARAREGNG